MDYSKIDYDIFRELSLIERIKLLAECPSRYIGKFINFNERLKKENENK